MATIVSAQNFISDIFYLTLTMNHRGYMKTISNYEKVRDRLWELRRFIARLEENGKLRGVSILHRNLAIKFLTSLHRPIFKHIWGKI